MGHTQVANIIGKGPESKYFSFTNHMVSVLPIQLCHCSRKAEISNTQTNGDSCVLIKLSLQKQVLSRTDYSLLTTRGLGFLLEGSDETAPGK